MWILLALLSALFAASRRVADKRLSTTTNNYLIGWLTHCCALPLSLAVTILSGQFLNPFQLGPRFWLPLIGVTLGFYPLNNYLYWQSLKHGELSNIGPIMSLWPVLSIIPAWLFLDEIPSVIGITGIIATVAGVYALGLKGRRLHRPWQPFVDSKSNRYTLVAVCLLTAVGIVDKVGIQASNALFFGTANTVGAVMILLLMILLRAPDALRDIPGKWRQLVLPGNLQAISSLLYMSAMALGPVAYVTAIRSSGSLIGSLMGIFVLKERFTLQKKLSFGLIAAGAVLLALHS